LISESRGILLENALFTDHSEIELEDIAEVLGSPEDLKQVKRSPLIRARASFEHALGDTKSLGNEALSSARLTLAYVYLAFQDYAKALEMAKQVLTTSDLFINTDNAASRLQARRVATARLYAAEASCALGESASAMQLLLGDGKVLLGSGSEDVVFDRLANDLSGVSVKTAAASTSGKRRHASAQAVVRSSASSVAALMGNLTVAKKFAMSAQDMEDICSTNPERSPGRRALIYTLLREGNHGPALALLRSL
jgi:tetratricopeptide (TPR) repeat protein